MTLNPAPATIRASHRSAAENAFNSNGPEGLVEAIGAALAELPDPEGLRGEWRAVFAPETRELVVEMDLLRQEVVPAVAQFRFMATAPAAVVPQPRKEAEVKQQYSRLFARLALRAINEVLAASRRRLSVSSSSTAMPGAKTGNREGHSPLPGQRAQQP